MLQCHRRRATRRERRRQRCRGFVGIVVAVVVGIVDEVELVDRELLSRPFGPFHRTHQLLECLVVSGIHPRRHAAASGHALTESRVVGRDHPRGIDRDPPFTTGITDASGDIRRRRRRSAFRGIEVEIILGNVLPDSEQLAEVGRHGRIDGDAPMGRTVYGGRPSSSDEALFPFHEFVLSGGQTTSYGTAQGAHPRGLSVGRVDGGASLRWGKTRHTGGGGVVVTSRDGQLGGKARVVIVGVVVVVVVDGGGDGRGDGRIEPIHSGPSIGLTTTITITTVAVVGLIGRGGRIIGLVTADITRAWIRTERRHRGRCRRHRRRRRLFHHHGGGIHIIAARSHLSKGRLRLRLRWIHNGRLGRHGRRILEHGRHPRSRVRRRSRRVGRRVRRSRSLSRRGRFHRGRRRKIHEIKLAFKISHFNFGKFHALPQWIAIYVIPISGTTAAE
mmetsp:Transcript_21864/g.45804  ORF Transcript_21864/g.45804 Transcript_21864/m.45804 type:complete len:445 (+) Transcript_21864:665-1999(+)